MRKSLLALAFALGTLANGQAFAGQLSTSVTAPTPVPADGIITGNYPVGGAETTYFMASNLKPGSLLVQIEFMGRPNRDKMLEFELFGPNGRRVTSFYVQSGLDANQTAARSIPIDDRGAYSLRVKTKGPETTTFKVALGGTAIQLTGEAEAQADGLSKSFLRPSALPADGTITGTFPGGEGVVTSYYVAVDLKAGDLLSQISFKGRGQVHKELELKLLDANGRRVASHYIMTENEANQTGTKNFAIDNSGRYVLQISTKGAAGTTFKVEVGGNSIATQ
jgi:hypothetical protein